MSSKPRAGAWLQLQRENDTADTWPVSSDPKTAGNTAFRLAWTIKPCPCLIICRRR